MDPVLETTPLPASEMPVPLDELTFPAFVMLHVVPDAPSMASVPEPVEVTAPVLVMVSGLSLG